MQLLICMNDHFRFPDTADWKRSETRNPFVPVLEEFGEHVLRPAIRAGLSVYDFFTNMSSKPKKPANDKPRARSATPKAARSTSARDKAATKRHTAKNRAMRSRSAPRARPTTKSRSGLTAPAAVSGRAARSHLKPIGGNRYSTRECLCEVLVPNPGALVGFYKLVESPLNPGNPALFPKLSRVAQLYEQYKMRLRVSFQPIAPTSAQAILGLFVDKDPADAAPSSMAALLNNKYSCAGAVWSPMSIDVDSSGRGTLYTSSTMTVSTDSDARLSQFGNLYAYLDYWNNSVAGTCLGYVWLDAEVEFLNPKEAGPDAFSFHAPITTALVNYVALPFVVDESFGYSPVPIALVGNTTPATCTASPLGGTAIRQISPPQWPGVSLRANSTHYLSLFVAGGLTVATGTIYAGMIYFRADNYTYLGSSTFSVVAPTNGQSYAASFAVSYPTAYIAVPIATWGTSSNSSWSLSGAFTPWSLDNVDLKALPTRAEMSTTTYNLPQAYDQLMAVLNPALVAQVTVHTDALGPADAEEKPLPAPVARLAAPSRAPSVRSFASLDDDDTADDRASATRRRVVGRP